MRRSMRERTIRCPTTISLDPPSTQERRTVSKEEVGLWQSVKEIARRCWGLPETGHEH